MVPKAWVWWMIAASPNLTRVECLLNVLFRSSKSTNTLALVEWGLQYVPFTALLQSDQGDFSQWSLQQPHISVYFLLTLLLLSLQPVSKLCLIPAGANVSLKWLFLPHRRLLLVIICIIIKFDELLRDIKSRLTQVLNFFSYTQKQKMSSTVRRDTLRILLLTSWLSWAVFPHLPDPLRFTNNLITGQVTCKFLVVTAEWIEQD